MLALEPRRQVEDHRHVADHALDVGLHDALGVGVGRAPRQHIAALVLDLVADVRHQHLRVADASRLQEVDDPDQVVAHAVQGGNLKGLSRPLPLVIGGLGRQVEVFVRPLDSRLRGFFVQRLESELDGLA
ncbi:hypothetical protein D9M68_925250 [compost metagenome]